MSIESLMFSVDVLFKCSWFLLDAFRFTINLTAARASINSTQWHDITLAKSQSLISFRWLQTLTNWKVLFMKEKKKWFNAFCRTPPSMNRKGIVKLSATKDYNYCNYCHRKFLVDIQVESLNPKLLPHKKRPKNVSFYAVHKCKNIKTLQLKMIHS